MSHRDRARFDAPGEFRDYYEAIPYYPGKTSMNLDDESGHRQIIQVFPADGFGVRSEIVARLHRERSEIIGPSCQK